MLQAEVLESTNVASIDTIPASNKRIRDRVVEVERLVNIMMPLARLQGSKVFLAIPLEDGQTLSYKITQRDSDQARTLVFDQYQETYGELPILQTFRAACVKVQAALFKQCKPVDATGEAVEDEEAEDKQPRSKKTDQYELYHRLIDALSDWKKQAIAITATYARVPLPGIDPGHDPVADSDGSFYSCDCRECVLYQQQSEYHGLYRLNGRSTLYLCDAYVEIEQRFRPASSNKRGLDSFRIRLTNSAGLIKIIPATSEQVVNGELASKLTEFCSFPDEERHRRYFLEALKGLPVLRPAQEEGDTLAWSTLPDSSLCWLQPNGVEAATGFVPADRSPLIGPAIPVTAYRGAEIPNDFFTPDIFDYDRALIYDYAPHKDIWPIYQGVRGLQAIAMLPDDLIPDNLQEAVKNGSMALSVGLFGPPRHGKNRYLNALLTWYGAGFVHDTRPLFSDGGGSAGKGDSNIGRNGLAAKMPYHMYVGHDLQCSPGDPGFQKQHELRAADINNATNYNRTGGEIGQKQGGTKSRDKPSGLDVRTSNYDHAITSIQESQEMIEWRACDFSWPVGVIGDEKASRLLDKHRLSGYALGQLYRQWIMQHHTSGEEIAALRERIAEYYEYARDLVKTEEYDWPGEADKHINHTVIMVLGSLIISELFLPEMLPGHWLIDWLDQNLIPMIENRAARSKYIKSLVNEGKGLHTFVLSTLRKLFSTSTIYMRGQRDTALDPDYLDGLPFGMKEAGYRSTIHPEHGETWQPGRQCVCYLIHKKQNIAFIPDLLMHHLKEAANDAHITLGSKEQLLVELLKRGVIVPDLDKNGRFQQHEYLSKIKGKPSRYITIPVDVLYLVEDIAEDVERQLAESEEEELEVSSRPTGPCEHCGSSLPAMPIIDGDLIRYRCTRCRQPRSTSPAHNHQASTEQSRVAVGYGDYQQQGLAEPDYLDDYTEYQAELEEQGD